MEAVVQTSGWPVRLDLTVRSIRCSELSPGGCPLEAPWQTFDQRGFVFGTRTFQSAERPCDEFWYQRNKKKDPWGPARQNRLMCWNVHQALKHFREVYNIDTGFYNRKKKLSPWQLFIFPYGNCQVNNRNTGFKLQSPLPQICPVSIRFFFFFVGAFCVGGPSALIPWTYSRLKLVWTQPMNLQLC